MVRVHNASLSRLVEKFRKRLSGTLMNYLGERDVQGFRSQFLKSLVRFCREVG